MGRPLSDRGLWAGLAIERADHFRFWSRAAAAGTIWTPEFFVQTNERHIRNFHLSRYQIGRASWRGRVWVSVDKDGVDRN